MNNRILTYCHIIMHSIVYITKCIYHLPMSFCIVFSYSLITPLNKTALSLTSQKCQNKSLLTTDACCTYKQYQLSESFDQPTFLHRFSPGVPIYSSSGQDPTENLQTLLQQVFYRLVTIPAVQPTASKH